MSESNQTLKLRRYPGPIQFDATQQNIFFGRDKDIDSLFETILDRKIVVLFSKSGLGKSSLLQAGIVPKFKTLELEDDVPKYTPINIRFKAYTGSESLSPLNETIESIQKDYPIKESYLHKIIPDDRSLWFFLKEQQREYKERNNFVLLFDQFEELFTYPQQQIDQFKILLKEVLDSQIPEDYRFELEVLDSTNRSTLTAEDLEWFYKPFEIKVVFAIRSDRLSYLDGLGDYFPEILSNRYKLNELTETQAANAIEEPAALSEGNFDCPTFEYAPEVLQEILRFLKDGNHQKIESFQLQLICQHIEEVAFAKKLKTVQLEDLGDLENVIQQYYDRQVAQIGNEEDQVLVKKLVEEGLILESEERRITLDQGIVKRDYNISDDLLKKLIDLHIVRTEVNSSGGFNVELSHDALIAPVLESKGIRRQKELEKERLEAEKEKFEQEKVERKLKQRRLFRIATLVSSLLFLVALGASFLALNQAQKAHEARNQATLYYEDLLVKTDSLEIAVYKLDSIKSAELLVEAKLLIRQDYFENALEKIDQILLLETINGEKYQELLNLRKAYEDAINDFNNEIGGSIQQGAGPKALELRKNIIYTKQELSSYISYLKLTE